MTLSYAQPNILLCISVWILGWRDAINLPDGQSIPLSLAIQGVHALGVPYQPHNTISLALLNQLGFVNNGIVQFKIMHVAHGGGTILMEIDVPQC